MFGVRCRSAADSFPDIDEKIFGIEQQQLCAVIPVTFRQQWKTENMHGDIDLSDLFYWKRFEPWQSLNHELDYWGKPNQDWISS